jgi:hypothetical protein
MKRHKVTAERQEVVQPILPARTAKTGRPTSERRLMQSELLSIFARARLGVACPCGPALAGRVRQLCQMASVGCTRSYSRSPAHPARC